MPPLDLCGSARLAGAALNRRNFLLGAAATALAGCNATARSGMEPAAYAPAVDPYYAEMYAAMPYEQFPVPAIDVSKVDPQFLRQIVPYPTAERPGTIVVDPGGRFLYVVREDGTAVRYGVGVGRAGFGWNGRAVVQFKRSWPRWTPTEGMMERDPELLQWANGMEPGLDNPLGARALYLFQNGRDTLYRLHGTNEPWSIGMALSSGCIRLFNQDIIDLHDRTPNGTPVVVLDSPMPPPALA